uniref:Uncharacterized protein n=1 Tax=Desulfatirhabdium butyrativorans TaxID=340467 RepID=A0A7C4RUL6_9BACT
MMEHEALLNDILARVAEKERDRIRKRIDEALARQARGDGKDPERLLRFVQDLDILLNMRGPEFIYSRGIAESLRVGEDMFELAYVIHHAME